MRGHEIVRFATFGMVRDEYLAWEAAHPGVSSFNVATPTPIDSADATRISRQASRAAYPYPFWGMAQVLAATETTAVDYAAPVTAFEDAGVSCHDLSFGPRADPARRDARWLCWKESDGALSIDVSDLVGAAAVRRWNVRDGTRASVPASTLAVGDEPLLFERTDAALIP